MNWFTEWSIYWLLHTLKILIVVGWLRFFQNFRPISIYNNPPPLSLIKTFWWKTNPSPMGAARIWNKYLRISWKFLTFDDVTLISHIMTSYRKINIASEKIIKQSLLSNSCPSGRKTWNFGYKMLFSICKPRTCSSQFLVFYIKICV